MIAVVTINRFVGAFVGHSLHSVKNTSQLVSVVQVCQADMVSEYSAVIFHPDCLIFVSGFVF